MSKRFDFKKNYVQIVRHVIQIVSFFLMPGLFISTLNAVGGIYQAIINGNFALETMRLNILVLIAVIPLTLVFGRVFCGFICAFGTMQEFVNILAKKLKIKQFKIPEGYDLFFKLFKYFILLFLFLAWVLKLTLDSANPWYVFGVYSNWKGWLNLGTFLSIGGALLFLIIVVSLFNERFFCRYLCPLGGLLTLVSRIRVFKVRQTSEGCVDCKMCNKNCPMTINVVEQLNKKGMIYTGTCINCLKCADACPKHIIGTNINDTVKFSAAAVAVSSIYFAGTISMQNAANNSGSLNSNVSIVQPAQKLYKDGTFSGSGEGFRGPVKVDVTTSDSIIRSIVVVSHSDDENYFNLAKGTILNAILSSQSTDVPEVSGATFSSKGIISGVKQALNIARIEDTGSSNPNASSTSISNSSASSEIHFSNDEVSSAKYKDGDYSGSGQGFRGTIRVTVTISGGRITAIAINSYVDDEQFFSRAKNTIINSIIAAQSTNVSTVSGATYSSRGIIQAVNNALSKAIITNEESSSNSSSSSNGSSSSSSSSGSSSSKSLSSSSSSQISSSSSSRKYKDGDFIGSGQGFRGTISVTVTISDDKIVAIVINSYRDDDKYFNRAKNTIINAIISSQSTNVSTVSGATYSSRGIIQAVNNALSKAALE